MPVPKIEILLRQGSLEKNSADRYFDVWYQHSLDTNKPGSLRGSAHAGMMNAQLSSRRSGELLRSCQRLWTKAFKVRQRLAYRSFTSTSTNVPRPASTIDVHTHMYYPRYMDILRKRAPGRNIPYVRLDAENLNRLVILPNEEEHKSTKTGRPIGQEYFSIDEKLEFMDRHGIRTSILSLANPWLDFLDPQEAIPLARDLNDQVADFHNSTRGRLQGLGVVPVKSISDSVEEIRRLARIEGIHGIIMSTAGKGSGLDDPELDPIWGELSRQGMTAFIHPHYGIGNEEYGGYGHSLFLALGFTFETTAAISRLILSGTLDRFPKLKLLIAHAGGCLPYLAGRLDSCVEGEPHLQDRLEKRPSEYLRDLYYDGVVYSSEALDFLKSLGLAERVMFGTDHPFFPPKEGGTANVLWPSCTKNLEAIGRLDSDYQDKVLYRNANTVFGI